MKRFKNSIILFILISLMILVLSMSVQASQTPLTFATQLPRFEGWGSLKTGHKDYAQARSVAHVSAVGSNYKADLAIYLGSTRVSAIATNVDDGQTRYFTVDSSATGKDVTLKGQAARWSIYEVDISGYYKADQ